MFYSRAAGMIVFPCHRRQEQGGERRHMSPKQRFGDLLLEMGVISRDQLHTALEYSKVWRKKLGKALVATSAITEGNLVKFLSSYLGIPAAELGKVEVTDHLLRMIPKELAVKLNIFPVSALREGNRNVLRVAMTDPEDVNLVKEVEFGTGCKIHPMLAEESLLAKMVRKHYQKIDYEPLSIESESRGFDSMQGFFPAGMNVVGNDGVSKAGTPPGGTAVPLDRPSGRESTVRRKVHIPPEAVKHAGPDNSELDAKLTTLLRLMVKKGLITKDEYLAGLQDYLALLGRK
jgi:hypothetical protein